MRQLVLPALLISLVACGTESTPSVAEIGWSFNYKDYTNDSAADDIRACDNQPASPFGPAYDPITKVHVVIADPAGQVQGVDKDYDCDLGVGGNRIPIRGIVKQKYTLTLEAKTANGTVLYRYVLADYDVTGELSETYELPTAGGEIHFFPRYQSSLTCPSDVARMRYSMYRKVNGNPEATATVSGVMEPTCEESVGRTSMELYIRGIPVEIEAGSYQTYNDYQLVLEALSVSDGVLHCRKNPSRTVRPGTDSMGGDESLSPGVCP